MSKIVSCYKWVMDEADIRINSDLSVDMSKAKGKISDYDKNAIEAAVNLAEVTGNKPVGLTFGSSQTKRSFKDALSRGLEEAYWVKADEAETADGLVTARALAAGVKAIGDVSLVICAEGASDTYARQTASRIGALLDLPVVTSISQISVDGNTMIALRKLDDCLETVKVDLPAVAAILPEAYQPRIPGLKAVMAAGKKPITEYKAEELGINLVAKRKVLEVKAYAQERKNIIVEGDAPKAKVAELVSTLRKEGVL